MQNFNNKSTQSEENKKSKETQSDAQIVKLSENNKAKSSANIETNNCYAIE